MQDPAAILAAAIMFIKAAGAKCRVLVRNRIIASDRFSAMVALDSVLFCTAVTYQLIVDFGMLVIVQHAAAHRADSLFFHFLVLHKTV